MNLGIKTYFVLDNDEVPILFLIYLHNNKLTFNDDFAQAFCWQTKYRTDAKHNNDVGSLSDKKKRKAVEYCFTWDNFYNNVHIFIVYRVLSTNCIII